jgi:ribosomal protein L29
MTKNDKQKMRDKNTGDLLKEISDEEKRLQELRFDLARGKVKNSSLVRNAKNNIATLKTLVREKERLEIKNNDGK